MGMMGVYFPEEYGGAGMSYLTYIGVAEKLAEYCATTSIMMMASESLCAWPVSYTHLLKGMWKVSGTALPIHRKKWTNTSERFIIKPQTWIN